MGVEFRQGRGLGWGMTYAGGAVTFERGAGPRRGDVQAWGGAFA